MKRLWTTLVSLLMLAAMLATALFVWLYRYDLQDWWKLRSYQPSPEVAALASDTSMSDYGKRLFYVKAPQILESQQFNQACTERESTIVLGCYDGLGIYIFNVVDPRLNGVKEVTSAHEMLHAAYDRLSNGERAQLGAWLADVRQGLTDQRILGIISSYGELSQTELDNELHSIFATELEHLPRELEDYYRRYFADRSRVVAFSRRYEEVFTGLRRQVDDYDRTLGQLAAKIGLLESSLTSESEALSVERQRLEQLLAANQTEAYNSSVEVFNNRLEAYNADVRQLRGLIDEYNDIVKLRNQLGLEHEILQGGLNSRFEEQPK